MGRTHIEVEDDRAYERARDMLEAADIDPEAVTYIEMSVVYVEESEDEETTGETPEEPEEDAEPTPEPEPGETTETREREGGTGGGGPPKEPYTGTKGEGAVMPDTHRARSMQALDDEEYRDAQEAFERVDHPDTDYDRVKNALSSVANKNPTYLDVRKKDDPEPRGPQNEYRLTEAGQRALEAGRMLASGEKMT